MLRTSERDFHGDSMSKYVVVKYGERTTKRLFTNLPDAIDYYDKQCKSAKGASVRLMRDEDMAILFHNTNPDSIIQIANGQYRDMNAKKKKKSTEKHPFGL